MPVAGPYTLQCDLQDARGNSYYLTFQNGIVSFNSGGMGAACQITWSPKSSGSDDGSIALGANQFLGRQANGNTGSSLTGTNFSLISTGSSNGFDTYMIRVQWTSAGVLQTTYLVIPDGYSPGDDLRFVEYTGNLSAAPRKHKWIFMPSQPQPRR